MAYNRKNFLIKVINIQQIQIDYNKKGVTNEFIFDNIIQPRYFISRTTFYNYLTINARKELTELGIDWKEQIKQ